jgi:hypothetical protein
MWRRRQRDPYTDGPHWWDAALDRLMLWIATYLDPLFDRIIGWLPWSH